MIILKFTYVELLYNPHFSMYWIIESSSKYLTDSPLRIIVRIFVELTSFGTKLVMRVMCF